MARYVKVGYAGGKPFKPTAETLRVAEQRQQDFVDHVMPAIGRTASRRFARFKPDVREELLLDAYAVAWREFLSAIQKGRDPLALIGRIALTSILHVLDFRFVQGQEAPQDALSKRAQRKRGFEVEYLENPDLRYGWDRIPDRVAFVIDFEAWRAQWDQRNREIIDAMAAGETARGVARTFGITEDGANFKRRRFRESWEQFYADAPTAA